MTRRYSVQPESVSGLCKICNMHPRVNILQPGPGVGGHCISVDPWFLVGDYPSLAKVIDESMKTNDGMPDFVLNRIYEIMKEKGMDELFSAAEKLHDDGYKFVLDLVGFFEDEYKERVELLESKGVVKFHGFQEEPRPYYATADCVVMPSYHEGMSNVNLEASATGRPVITTDIPSCRESVENEYTGWLCEPKSVDSLYEKMKAFLETDISKREVMGKYARQKMVDEFDKEIIVNDTIKALKL